VGVVGQVDAGDPARPESGARRVERTRMSVVLPAPFGPSRALHRAGRDNEVDAVERLDGPKDLETPSTSIIAGARLLPCQSEEVVLRPPTSTSAAR
jgi:hypothetical protein